MENDMKDKVVDGRNAERKFEDVKYVFYADDSDYKRDEITAALKKIFPNSEVFAGKCTYDIMSCLMRYKKEIKDMSDRCMFVTDMSMPWQEGDMDIENDAGISVLRELARLRLKVPAVVVSSERQNDGMLKDAYKNCLGSIVYDAMVHTESSMRNFLSEYFA